MTKPKVSKSLPSAPEKPANQIPEPAPLLEAKVIEMPEDSFEVLISKAELRALHNAVHAFELLRAANDADSEQVLATFSVLFDNFAGPAWNAMDELETRFNDAGGDTLD